MRALRAWRYPDFLMQLDPTVDELTDIKTAVSEAVTNAIVHGYREKNGTVYITMRILAGNVAYVKIRDCGCGIEDVKRAMEPLYTTAPEEERAGLGLCGHAVVHGYGTCAFGNGEGHDRRDDQGAPHPDR